MLGPRDGMFEGWWRGLGLGLELSRWRLVGTGEASKGMRHPKPPPVSDLKTLYLEVSINRA